MLRHVARIPAISRIPTEILIMIFVIYLEGCKKAKKWDLIYVCRAWKTAVLCMPYLWTRINFRAPDWIREHYIQRSGSRPLDVFIPTVQPPQGLTSLIISDTVARARKLTVLSTHKEVLEVLDSHLLGENFTLSRLEALIIGTAELPSFDPKPSILGKSVPPFFRSFTNISPNLKSVSLSLNSDVFPAEALLEVVQILASIQSLSTLEIYNLRERTLGGLRFNWAKPRPIAAMLKVLRFDDCASGCMAYFIASLEMPNLVTIELPDTPVDTESPDSRYLMNNMPYWFDDIDAALLDQYQGTLRRNTGSVLKITVEELTHTVEIGPIEGNAYPTLHFKFIIVDPDELHTASSIEKLTHPTKLWLAQTLSILAQQLPNFQCFVDELEIVSKVPTIFNFPVSADFEEESDSESESESESESDTDPEIEGTEKFFSFFYERNKIQTLKMARMYVNPFLEYLKDDPTLLPELSHLRLEDCHMEREVVKALYEERLGERPDLKDIELVHCVFYP
ncbi:hypothetical protein SISSUDRAFT_1054224 [Sistotremastrum suecicum HHB10207 ss-3]|uniref:Uncharacterized protein n=1 Tax=Sistotremastrum suecicum HHB10207 ss-3 TaxID=1314776 RepID=A0A165YNQ3_9AGAM|nr:hypothetical protein SISSUDRAFT_1054224 [Sistotremastrum suecicum HHB10207 ss-3]